MPGANKALLLLGLVASLLPLACNATCVRDSDCMGNSVCSQDRCILIVRSDAGRASTPAPSTPGDAPDDTDGADAGRAPAPLDAGAR